MPEYDTWAAWDQALELGSMWQLERGSTTVYTIPEASAYVQAGRRYDDGGRYGSGLHYWAIYMDGPLMPPTADGWEATAMKARGAAVHTIIYRYSPAALGLNPDQH